MSSHNVSLNRLPPFDRSEGTAPHTPQSTVLPWYWWLHISLARTVVCGLLHLMLPHLVCPIQHSAYLPLQWAQDRA